LPAFTSISKPKYRLIFLLTVCFLVQKPSFSDTFFNSMVFQQAKGLFDVSTGPNLEFSTLVSMNVSYIIKQYDGGPSQ
jgi:hypothetical protein